MTYKWNVSIGLQRCTVPTFFSGDWVDIKWLNWQLVRLYDSDPSHPLRSSDDQLPTHHTSLTKPASDLNTLHRSPSGKNHDTINKSASRSERRDQGHSLIVLIPTLHANLLHNARRACQNLSPSSNVLTFLSCWKSSERAEGYSWCVPTENTRRDYVRAVTFWSGLWPALVLHCFEDQSDVLSDGPPRSAPLVGWIDVLMQHQ